MDSLISTFHIDWHLIVAQAINFVVVLLVLYFFALKPLKKLMDERGKTIESGLENAKKQEALLAQAAAEYAALMTKANVEGMEKMKEAKKDLEVFRLKEMEKLQAEFEAAKIVNAKQNEADKLKMLEEVKKEAVAFVISATEKVLGETVNGKVETKLVEESIKNI